MKKMSMFAAALAVGLMFPLTGAAQQAAPGTPQQNEVRPRAPRPQLTEAQRDAMRKLREEQRTAAEATRAELRALHTQLTKELAAAQINSGRVNELRDEIARKQAAVTAAQIDQRARMAALLTPEQRQAMGERGARMGERAGRMAARARGARGQVMRQRGQAMRQRGEAIRQRGLMRQQRANGVQLRQRIEKLERELEELRKKIG